MESNSGLNILAVAQREYMQQLNDIMVPFLLANFDQMYERAVKDSKGKNVLRQFQEYLRDIKNWNQGMVQDATKEIVDSCGYFDKLLAAVFVGYVKILSSVRLTDAKRKIPIRLPKNSDFVFKVYEECAKAIYKDPYWLSEDLSDDDKLERMLSINSIALEKVLKAMIPVNKILETYMSAVPGDEVESQLGDPEDTEDPEVLQPDDTVGNDEPIPEADVSEPLPDLDAEPEPEPEAEAEAEAEPEMDEPTEEDVKSIPVSGMVPPQENEDDDEDDDLMPGAPDTRK